MSYDVEFMVPAGRPEVSRDEFVAWFEGRAHYHVRSDQAFFENDATGGHFWFSWRDASGVDADADPDADDGDPDDTGAPDDDLGPAGVAFEMNYNRPFWFALEAEPELTAFVGRFALQVDDPQVGRMARGPYDPERFVAGWTKGNRFAFGALAAAGDDAPVALPAATVRAAWRWNLARDTVQATFGEEVFVPRAVFVRDRSVVRSCVTWTWEVPTAIPAVEAAILVRPATGLFGRKTGFRLGIVPLEGLPGLGPVVDSVGGPYRLTSGIDEPAIRAAFQSVNSMDRPSYVGPDTVIEVEELDQALAMPPQSWTPTGGAADAGLS
jgi:hypothetical protein